MYSLFNPLKVNILSPLKKKKVLECVYIVTPENKGHWLGFYFKIHIYFNPDIALKLISILNFTSLPRLNELGLLSLFLRERQWQEWMRVPRFQAWIVQI